MFLFSGPRQNSAQTSAFPMPGVFCLSIKLLEEFVESSGTVLVRMSRPMHRMDASHRA
jgi:hypothetical protein